MKYIYVYYLIAILYSINLTYSQKTAGEEKELEFLSSKLTTNSHPIIRSANYLLITHLGLCVSANGNGKKITQENCGTGKGPNNLHWRAIHTYSETKYYFHNYDVCLDNFEEKKINGNPIVGYSVNDSSSQYWHVESANNGESIRLRFENSEFCLDNNNSNKEGTEMIIWECNINNSNQWFKLKWVSN